MIKNLPAVQETGFDPWARKIQEGNGYPLQGYFLEISVNKGAWWATVSGVKKSWTRLSN